MWILGVLKNVLSVALKESIIPIKNLEIGVLLLPEEKNRKIS